jgi:hypothetical protein
LLQSTGAWLAGVVSGGHFGSVNDFVWGVNGEFILSVSSDQTTRLHAVWSSADNKSEVSAVQLKPAFCDTSECLTEFFATGGFSEFEIVHYFSVIVVKFIPELNSCGKFNCTSL